MSIVNELTPTHYKLARIGITRTSEGAVVAIIDMRITNADGEQLVTHNLPITLTAGERQAVSAFLDRELAIFEADTGLTECTIEPEL